MNISNRNDKDKSQMIEPITPLFLYNLKKLLNLSTPIEVLFLDNGYVLLYLLNTLKDILNIQHDSLLI
jgi:hypothetical protein